ncbi:MAG TPA: AAA family ATPase [Holophagaceae bacterium]|nr:AAA family ATPase [Holophagaceae bacterium]HJW34721.1 AAA family ATPase [Holophagaceae bacterium]
MSPRLTPGLQKALQMALQLAAQRRHELASLEHLLLALLEEPSAAAALAGCAVDLPRLKADLEGELAKLHVPVPPGESFEVMPTLGLQRVVERAWSQALSSERAEVDGGLVLAMLLEEKDSHARFLLRKHGVQRLTLLRTLSHSQPAGAPAPPPEGEEGEGPAVAEDPLTAYASDLVARARKGELDPLVGREPELKRVLQILLRRRKNNPLLLGDPGVGKTALVEGLAQRLAMGDVPEALASAKLYALDLGSLMAGTRYRGDFEQRLKALLKALQDQEAKGAPVMLFIDELHTVVGAGATSGGSLDAANLLKPALSGGSLRCIGATTFQEMKQSLDKDRALARRFQPVDLAPPSEADAVEILKGLRSRFEKHHGVKAPDEVLQAAVRLAAKHLVERHLPDSALDVLDEAGAAERLKPKKQRVKSLTVAHVEAVVAQLAKVPSESVGADDREALRTLEADLAAKVFGQGEAIAKVAQTVKLARAGLRNADKPMGCFLFAGPTGVGKTELAKQLASTLGIAFLRFDMSECMEKHAVARLIGAPPGYVGFEEGGLLTDAVRRSPHAVVLLDEIEKAHPDLQGILLQVMDRAALTDSHGRTADFRHVILVMTTNVGAQDLSGRRLGFTGDSARSAKGALEKAFSPEFRNRLDAALTFHALPKEAVRQVAARQLGELAAQVKGRRVDLTWTEAALDWLAAKGYEPAFGARPMARLLEQQVKQPLSEALLFGALRDGGACEVDADGTGLRLRTP